MSLLCDHKEHVIRNDTQPLKQAADRDTAWETRIHIRHSAMWDGMLA